MSRFAPAQAAEGAEPPSLVFALPALPDYPCADIEGHWVVFRDDDGPELFRLTVADLARLAVEAKLLGL
jgi:hypothetical protein